MTITAKLITDSSITIMLGGKTYILTDDNHQHYTKLRQALKINDIDTVKKLIDMPTAIKTFSKGVVVVHDGIVMYEDKPMHNALTRRMLRQMEEGFNIQPLIKFMENLMANPSSVAREELYLWLEANNNPITDDGCFIGFKRVRLNYRDHHSGTVDNSVGQKPEMDRTQVDDNRLNTCSAGLHFAAESYLPHFHANSPGHTMVLKINPADVVSIPVDYSYAKGRCWKYEVIDEVTTDGFQKYYDTPVHGATSDDIDENEDDIEDEDDSPETFTYEVCYVSNSNDTPVLQFSCNELVKAVMKAHYLFDAFYDNVIVTNVKTGIVELNLVESHSYENTDDNQDAPTTEDETENVKPVELAPVLSDMLFTRTQACAILKVSNDTMTDILSAGVVAERVARGGKNWIRIK